jgi:hypothetical protein
MTTQITIWYDDSAGEQGWAYSANINGGENFDSGAIDEDDRYTPWAELTAAIAGHLGAWLDLDPAAIADVENWTVAADGALIFDGAA